MKRSRLILLFIQVVFLSCSNIKKQRDISSSEYKSSNKTGIIFLIGASKKDDLKIEGKLLKKLKEALNRDNPHGYNKVLVKPYYYELYKRLPNDIPDEIEHLHIIIQAHGGPNGCNTDTTMVMNSSSYNPNEIQLDSLKSVLGKKGRRVDVSMFTCYSGFASLSNPMGDLFGSSPDNISFAGDRYSFFELIIRGGKYYIPFTAEETYILYHKFISGLPQKLQRFLTNILNGLGAFAPYWWAKLSEDKKEYEIVGVREVFRNKDDKNVKKYLEVLKKQEKAEEYWRKIGEDENEFE